MECVVCGGTNFIKDSGFFFCSECQTQSQEVQEHVFQDDYKTQEKSFKKVKSTASTKSNHLTSWECYNVILLSLTNELIRLGADKSFKKIVKCLWMRYLQKLEVLHLKHDRKPKMSIINIKRDLKITNNLEKRKVKRKRTLSTASSTDTVTRRQRTKMKTDLAKSQYSDVMSDLNESRSLHNETLESLGSNSSGKTKEKINFNKFSKRELKRRMSTEHVQEHRDDPETSLKCHKFTYGSCSLNYEKGVYFISPIKIYSILYLALLIKRDPIQLGDFFRFLREGHLNYTRFSSLFPENYSDKILNIRDHSKKTLFSHKEFRTITLKLAEFLDVEEYIVEPDLVELAKRYCFELNLPEFIFKVVEFILLENPLKFRASRRNFIPNYEARVMSLILFVLKLMFNFDGVTEQRLSIYANSVNKENGDLKMFNVMNWMKHISYRQLIVQQYHFPSSYSSNAGLNVDLLLEYKKTHSIFESENKRLVSDMVGYKNLLRKIQYLQDPVNSIEYPASLTPFDYYFHIISSIKNNKKIQQFTNIKFETDSFDFLAKPERYLNMDKTTFKEGGANDNWKLEEMNTQIGSAYLIPKSDTKFCVAEFIPTSGKIKNKDNRKEIKKSKKEKVCISNTSYGNHNLNDNIHYLPHKKYYLNLWGGIEMASKENLEKHLNKFNDNFKFVFNECSRIIEQHNHDLYIEFQTTELYLIYCSNFKDATIRRSVSSSARHYIRQAEFDW